MEISIDKALQKIGLLILMLEQQAEQYEQKIKMLEETIKELSQAKTVKNSKV